MNTEEFSSMIRQEMSNISRQTESMVEAETKRLIKEVVEIINNELDSNESSYEQFAKQIHLIAFTIFTKKANAIVRIVNDEAAVLVGKISQTLSHQEKTL